MIKYIISAVLLCSTAFAQDTIKLNTKNTVLFNKQVAPITVMIVSVDLYMKRVALPKEETLYLVLESGGGEVGAGLEFINFARQIPNLKVICTYCGSMAGAIFEMIEAPRLVTDKSIMLMHEMKLVITAKELTPEEVINFKKESDEFDKIFYSIIGCSKEDYERMITNKDWVVQGSDILILKLADEKVKLKCDKKLTKKTPKTCKE